MSFNAVLLLAFAGYSTTAGARGGSTSNGGDTLPYLFLTAQEQAAELIANLSDSALPIKTDPKIREFLLNNRKKLAEDIEKSPHSWTEEHLDVCGRTGNTPGAVIQFSLSGCKNATLTEAIPLLIHESIHHFGIVDEGFAYAASQAAYQGREEKDPTGLCSRLTGTWRQKALWPDEHSFPLEREIVVSGIGCREFHVKGIFNQFEILLKNRRESWQRVKDDAALSVNTQLFFGDSGLLITYRSVAAFTSPRPDDLHQGAMTFKIQSDGSLLVQGNRILYSQKDVPFADLTNLSRSGQFWGVYAKAKDNR